MKIHTKHLVLCEKGGKFNKTLNTICKLQEDLIEPQKWKEVFVSLIDVFPKLLFLRLVTATDSYGLDFSVAGNSFCQLKLGPVFILKWSKV